MSTTDTVSQNSTVEEQVRVLGFGWRLLAQLIDGLLITFFTFGVVVAIFFLALFLSMFNPYDPVTFNGLIIISALIISLVYYVGSWSKSGQTVGKSMLGMRVVSTDGSGISVGKAVLRYVGYIISGLVFSLGFLWINFTDKRQGWHDKLAGTYVIDIDDDFSSTDTIKFIHREFGPNWLWIVMWFILALAMPSALLTSLWLLSPIITRLMGG